MVWRSLRPNFLREEWGFQFLGRVTPNAGYSSTDLFTFKVNDGTTDSNVAQVENKI